MFGWFKKAAKVTTAIDSGMSGFFSTHASLRRSNKTVEAQWGMLAEPKLPSVTIKNASTGMDELQTSSLKQSYRSADMIGIPDAQLMWYAGQTFIGYQICAILAQHWLIDKACSMPARDAVRHGWELSINDGIKIDPKILDQIKKQDKILGIKKQCIEFVRMGRIFGIRIALFVVDSTDPDYYEKPFNIDGITEGSYKGISQVDPYWCMPQLTGDSVNDPASQNFYEPEFWRIGNKLYHRSHLVIFTTGAVPDVLKSNYYYGGVPLPQRIYERVYAAERTANEAPMLAMTKRLTILNMELEKALLDQQAFEQKLQVWADYRDNYGVKVAGIEEKVTQIDTALSDMDSLIMTQYQLVAAEAEVPGTKLLGTQPKGFNSTGEYEEASYHESLESLQENDLTPLLTRHYQIQMRSYIIPILKTQQFEIVPEWQPLDALTAIEQAELNLVKAQTGDVYLSGGVIDSQDERNRISSDPQSGYNGIPTLAPQPDPIIDPQTGQPTPQPKPVGGGAGKQPGALGKPSPPTPAPVIADPARGTVPPPKPRAIAIKQPSGS